VPGKFVPKSELFWRRNSLWRNEPVPKLTRTFGSRFGTGFNSIYYFYGCFGAPIALFVVFYEKYKQPALPCLPAPSRLSSYLR
jgi:hypothetical protein